MCDQDMVLLEFTDLQARDFEQLRVDPAAAGLKSGKDSRRFYGIPRLHDFPEHESVRRRT
jgi:hypothetical protein